MDCSSAASINSTNRLENACQMHRTICNILLSAYESLQSSLEMMRTKVPTDSKQNIGNAKISEESDS